MQIVSVMKELLKEISAKINETEDNKISYQIMQKIKQEQAQNFEVLEGFGKPMENADQFKTVQIKTKKRPIAEITVGIEEKEKIDPKKVKVQEEEETSNVSTNKENLSENI